VSLRFGPKEGQNEGAAETSAAGGQCAQLPEHPHDVVRRKIVREFPFGELQEDVAAVLVERLVGIQCRRSVAGLAEQNDAACSVCAEEPLDLVEVTMCLCGRAPAVSWRTGPRPPPRCIYDTAVRFAT
jgi:hypothetical protein